MRRRSTASGLARSPSRWTTSRPACAGCSRPCSIGPLDSPWTRWRSLAGSLEDFAAHGGPKLSAVLGGATAALEGRNPIWGAIRGAVSAMSPAVKAALIIVLVLALVLLPVTVLVVLIVLIVLAIIAAVRAGSAS